MSDDFCPRQIIFEIPGNPGVLVTATEDGSGGIDFVVDVQGDESRSADLRGLFFDIDESKLGGLGFSGGDGLIVEMMVDANEVIDLGNGANMQGKTKDGFDVGLEFGTPGAAHDFVDGPVSFSVTNTAGDLTLDDIAHQRFGARTTSVGQKLIVLAPAAPDANDDSYQIFEDNSSGLDDPSKTPTDFVMTVLDNDTDADPDDVIYIKSIHEQPEHGIVTIAPDGQTLIYTPELDYAGQVSFEYCIDDGNGGQDHALVTLDIEAVADVPTISYELAATANVNEVLITVTAAQDDDDSSEFIDSILSSILPAGVSLSPVSYDPATEPDQIVKEFLLTLPLDQDAMFDLTFTAWSEETSNGDQESNSAIIPIVYEYNSTTVDAQFTATDQSIWSNGDAFTFTDDRFLGFDTGPGGGKVGPDILYVGLDYDLMAGFQSTLEFNGGEIDATADYEITVETNYNKTVDVLLIDTAALFESAIFSTTGPQGHYSLDFLYDFYLRAYAGIDISVDLFGNDVGYKDEGNIFKLDVSDTINLIDLDSADLEFGFDFPPPFNSLSLDFAWPTLNTNGTVPPGTSTGESNNFLQLNLDVDQLLSQLLFGGINPFNPSVDLFGVAYFDLDIIDFDLIAALNFVQNFELGLGDLQGTFAFEDGTSQTFTLGDSIQVFDAQDIDAGGDGDGIVEFQFTVHPDADLSNETLLQFNVGYNLDLLSVTMGYDIGVASDEFTRGPLIDLGGQTPIADVTVYDSTFALNFGDEVFGFAA